MRQIIRLRQRSYDDIRLLLCERILCNSKGISSNRLENENSNMIFLSIDEL